MAIGWLSTYAPWLFKAFLRLAKRLVQSLSRLTGLLIGPFVYISTVFGEASKWCRNNFMGTFAFIQYVSFWASGGCQRLLIGNTYLCVGVFRVSQAGHRDLCLYKLLFGLGKGAKSYF